MWDSCWGSPGRFDDVGWWAGGGLFLALLGLMTLALVVGIVLMVSRTNLRKESLRFAGSAGADEVLAERFARGEIDEQEYLLRRRVLAETRGK